MTSHPSGAGSGVVIIGAGIAGMATAYYLAKAGIRSTVIERDGLASHASGFAYGGLSGGIPNGPEPNQPVIRHSMALFKELAMELPGQSDVDIQYQDRPALKIALNDDEASALTQHLDWQRAQPGYQVTMLDHDQVLALEPRINPDVVAGMHIEGGADVEPYRLTLALAQAAEKMGVVIRTGNVVGLHHHGSQVRGVALDGEEIPAETVVLAMGPWSGAATEWTGVNVPVRPLKGQIIRLQAPGEPYAFSIGHLKHYAMTKPADGFVWCGTTEEEAGFDESKTTESRDAIIESTLLMLPSLADADLALQTACLRPVTPDNVLMLGGMPGIDGLYIATGGGRQGIMMGPGMGQITADLIAKGASPVDLAAYDAGRFTT
jgi:glycine/D-amino acid oxidase-like deaminating enzyme